MLAGLTEKGNDVNAITGRYRSVLEVKEELNTVKKHWIDKVNIDFETGNAKEDNYLKWICFQPILRRIYGCSFLPHHDYGKVEEAGEIYGRTVLHFYLWNLRMSAV